MKTYSVTQIAELLDTNPETVRRWIREDKLKAVQVSRKDGNVVTEDELRKFLKAAPKYMTKFSTRLAAIAPVLGITTLVGGLLAGAIGYYDEKSKTDLGILPSDLKKYLITDIERIENAIAQKRQLIQQTEAEISEMERQIEQYKKLFGYSSEDYSKSEVK